MLEHYILAKDGKTPIMEPDLMTWARWYENAKRHVGNDKINDVEVSTVFLGLDHAYTGGHLVLWETMVFGGEFDQDQERYTSYEDAVAGHANWLAKVLHSTSGKEPADDNPVAR